jgi:hypothetical protein
MTDAATLPTPLPTPPALPVREREGAISWDSLPRRIVTLWLPLFVFIFVLLFPFYWMAITTSSRTTSFTIIGSTTRFGSARPPCRTSRSCCSRRTTRIG